MTVYVVVGIDAVGDVFQVEVCATREAAEKAKKYKWCDVYEREVVK